MSKREVAELACRILSLYYFVTNLHAFLGIPISLWAVLSETLHRGSFAETGIVLLTSALGTLFVLGIVWFLWTRSAWIAEKIVPQDANYSRWPRVRAADLQVVVFSMIGLSTLIAGVAYFSSSVGMYLAYVFTNDSPITEVSFLGWLFMEDTLVSLVKILIGLWLIIGSRGIVRLVRRLQQPKFDSTNEDPRAFDPQAVEDAST